MLLGPEQTLELLKIIDTNQAILFATQFGPEFLSSYDKSLLESHGIDWESLYSEELDSITSSFHLGMLAQTLKDTQKLKDLKFNTLKEYVRNGKYIPLSSIERNVINAIKQATYGDIKTNNGKIFQDINGILKNNNLKEQQKFLTKELLEGIKKKSTLREIANEISRKTGDWERNFDRIVEYQANSAYQAGRLASIEQQDKELLVYKRVFTSGCKHCVRLYLTKGPGSEPKTFTIEQLRANGTNIGRKTEEWLPTVESTHPHCFANKRTPIYTSKGWKYISDIKVGDLVLTHKKRFRKVTQLLFSERHVDYLYNIVCQLKNKDRKIMLRDITGEHPVLVNNNWIKTEDIKVGQKLSLLHDNCSYNECNNNYPIYSRDEIDRCKVDHCSVSCKSYDKSQNRTEYERKSLTENARTSVKDLYPNASMLHTVESRKKSAISNGKRNTSYIELKLRHFLDRLSVEYKIGHIIERVKKDSKNRKRYFYPDIYIPSLNIVLEADGENWHNKEIDSLRDSEIKKSIGADTFRFSEVDIRDNGEKVFREIERIVKNHKGEYSFQHIEIVEIQKRKISKNYKPMLYNFSVEEDESYIVNGFPVHNCRCLIFSKPPNSKWDTEKQRFEIDKTIPILKQPRKPIRVTINGEKLLV